MREVTRETEQSELVEVVTVPGVTTELLQQDMETGDLLHQPDIVETKYSEETKIFNMIVIVTSDSKRLINFANEI